MVRVGRIAAVVTLLTAATASLAACTGSSSTHHAPNSSSAVVASATPIEPARTTASTDVPGLHGSAIQSDTCPATAPDFWAPAAPGLAASVAEITVCSYPTADGRPPVGLRVSATEVPILIRALSQPDSPQPPDGCPISHPQAPNFVLLGSTADGLTHYKIRIPQAGCGFYLPSAIAAIPTA